jgi:signal transduction histidine kinase
VTSDSDEGQCVLFVDDEPNLLKALQRLCRREAFSVLTANSGAQALIILAQQDVDLVVSDLRMPGMDGIALFFEVARLYPDIPRILLSGNADMEAMVNALNTRQLSYFLPKPWDEEHLRETLREFLQRRQMEKAFQSLVTTVSRQNDELLQFNEQVTAEAALKSKFLSVMSHELRTPVNGIHGIFDLLRGETDGEAAKLVDLGLSTARHLISIVDDILDYSKLESNAVVLEQIAFLPMLEAQSAFKLAQLGANSQSLKFDLQIQLDATLKLWGDPVRIRQILMNLLGNAVKFTEQGVISLTVSYELAHLVLRVEDTGIGIVANKQHLLYGEFTTLDASHARRFGGTGLGLSIVHRLVTQMQGDITLVSEEGAGACFTVRLPLATTDSRIVD